MPSIHPLVCEQKEQPPHEQDAVVDDGTPQQCLTYHGDAHEPSSRGSAQGEGIALSPMSQSAAMTRLRGRSMEHVAYVVATMHQGPRMRSRRPSVGSSLLVLPLDMPLPLIRLRTAFSRMLQFFLWLPPDHWARTPGPCRVSPTEYSSGFRALGVFHGIHLEGILWYSLSRHGQWQPCVPS